jgi:hypothetical protein
MDILAWIESNALVTWVREAPTVLAYPTVLAIHTFGLIFLVGPNVAIDLRIFGFAPNVPLRPMVRFFPVMYAGFWINAVSGLILWAIAPLTFLRTPIFLIKLAAVFLGMLNLRLLKRRVFGNPANLGPGPVLREAKILAGASIAFWGIAIYAGRTSAYLPFVQRQTALVLLIALTIVALLARFVPLGAWSSTKHHEPLPQSK